MIALARRTGTIAAILFALSAVAVALFGGYDWRLGALRVSSHDALRDLQFAVSAAAVTFFARPRTTVDAQSIRAHALIARASRWIALSIACGVLAVGILFGTHCACGSDSFGYVSQATLWATNTVHVVEPAAAWAAWPLVERTLAPLGYRPAVEPMAIVPTYASGYPLMMAAAVKLTRTASAVFAVVPVLGALVVWMTFCLGRRLRDPATGLWAAIVVAASPTFLWQTMQPMADVPAAACWLGVMTLIVRDTRSSALTAGVVGSAAVMVRPNLAPLVLVPFAWLAYRDWCDRDVRGRALLFLAGVVPGFAVVSWTQTLLYGSPLASGYGRPQDIYAWANVVPNGLRYPAWIWQTHGPLVLAGMIAPFVVPRSGTATSAAQRSFGWVVFSFSAGVLIAYLGYTVFDDAGYTRFLLPAIPLLAVAAVWAVQVWVDRIGTPAARAAATVALALLALDVARRVDIQPMLDQREHERLYADVARHIERHTTGSPIVIAMQHSGSLRFYGNRETLRYDWLDAAWLDRAIAEIRARGRGPLILLEDWEESAFCARFRGQRYGALDWPPAVEFMRRSFVARLYDPAARDAVRPPATDRVVFDR